ncbi:hypothetical protein BGI36_09015 [Snodgrassella communis]|uniref:hypothetical protein n=1 Tax=Snodgrassella communis TaxID=2946699 RepID=UPI000C1F2133|nr:hypothetical protein [Snodgrassella communis]PIT19982.1 hypothetical protein BGI36_09015 [Snodgrassella communis]
MKEQKNSLIYNQIDFVIKAPRFHITFSYSGDKRLSFVREYLLRLLLLCPCCPEKIATYFEFSQYETENALNDLANRNWIEYLADGNIGLTTAGKKLFKYSSTEPILVDLRTEEIEMYMELLNENFIEKKYTSNKKNAINLNIPLNILAFSSKYAEHNFQQQFIELKEEGKIKLLNNNGQLYKIDGIEVLNHKYFRFTQFFSLDKHTGNQLFRNDIQHVNHSEKIVQQVTDTLEKYKRTNNLKEIIKSMNDLEDSETLTIITPNFNFEQFNAIKQKSLQKNYFVGQTYHQGIIQEHLMESLEKLRKNIPQTPKKLFWLGVENIYWGAQRKCPEQIASFNQNEFYNINKQKHHLYDFRLYLPLEKSKLKNTKRFWLSDNDNNNEKKSIYAFKEGFLNNNTEIIVLEDHFAVVCYHVQLDHYDVTLPIGFTTQQPEKVKQIFQLVQSYLNEPIFDKDESSTTKDFGKIF